MDEDARVRIQSADSLGKLIPKIQSPRIRRRIIQSLNQCLTTDPEPTVREKAAQVIGAIGEEAKMSGDRIINTQIYHEINIQEGNYIQGDYYNLNPDLSQAAIQIQDLLSKLEQTGYSTAQAEAKVAQNMATEAQQNPEFRDKIVRWGQSLGNATVTDVVKGVVKLALRSAGLPLP